MNAIPPIILMPLSALYGTLMRARSALYQTGALRTHAVNVPVISVGNLTTGGTGKTPLVEWLARACAGEGARTCVLTRGYKRANPKRRVLVSDGENLFADAREAGDEPRLLAENLLGMASVVCDADRVAAARWALTNLRTEVFVLDDGFQHERLKRDLDILTIDATNAWGGNPASLLPRGRLREPLSAMRRADLIVMTRTEQARHLQTLRTQIGNLSGGLSIIAAQTRTKYMSALANSLHQRDTHIEDLPQLLAAFCAIGNPQSFFDHLRREQINLTYTRAFADHYAYTQADIDSFTREAQKWGARGFLTTAKDAVKLRSLRFDLPCYFVAIELAFDDEATLRRKVRETLKPYTIRA
jgi:tetraacyldisaccharide 4'-kinase